MCKMMLESGADVNIMQSDGTTPLHLAGRHGNREITQLLMKQREVDMNPKMTVTAQHTVIDDEDDRKTGQKIRK